MKDDTKLIINDPARLVVLLLFFSSYAFNFGLIVHYCGTGFKMTSAKSNPHGEKVQKEMYQNLNWY